MIYENAYAKLNLCLSVGGVLDNGYHSVETVMTSLSLADKLCFEKSDSLRVVCEGVDEEKNIVTKAARAFFAAAGIDGGAIIRVEKHIPMAAGLGGGSADAAATLRGLNRLYGECLSREELKAIASTLGADVPFCVDNGPAFGEGVGDVLTGLPFMKLYFVLLFDETPLSTPTMYRLLDERGGDRADARAMRAAIESGDTEKALSLVANSFLPLTVSLVPAVADKLALLGGVSCITGKGPTVFGVYTDEATARDAASRVGGCFCESVE